MLTSDHSNICETIQELNVTKSLFLGNIDLRNSWQVSFMEYIEQVTGLVVYVCQTWNMITSWYTLILRDHTAVDQAKIYLLWQYLQINLLKLTVQLQLSDYWPFSIDWTAVIGQLSSFWLNKWHMWRSKNQWDSIALYQLVMSCWHCNIYLSCYLFSFELFCFTLSKLLTKWARISSFVTFLAQSVFPVWYLLSEE